MHYRYRSYVIIATARRASYCRADACAMQLCRQGLSLLQLPRYQPRSGSANIGDEAINVGAQYCCLAAKLLRREQYLVGCGSGLVGRPIDAGNVARYLARSLRGFLNAASDLACRGTLLFDSYRNRRCNLVDGTDRAADALDSLYRVRRRALHGAYLRRYFIGRFCGLAGKRFDLVGDHRKTPARFASTSRFDRRVQGQQIGLAGDVADEFDDVTDFLGRGRQALHRDVGTIGLGDGLTGNLG